MKWESGFLFPGHSNCDANANYRYYISDLLLQSQRFFLLLTLMKASIYTGLTKGKHILNAALSNSLLNKTYETF